EVNEDNTFGEFELEETVKQVLLEWGYGKETMINLREKVLEKQDSCPSDIAMIPQDDQEETTCVTMRVLCESLNRLWKGETSERREAESWSVSWRVLQCGSLTPSHLLGSWDPKGTKWRKGVLFKALTEAQNMQGERWLILVGPFSPPLLTVLNYLCQPSPTFTDEALHQVILGQHVRIILEVEDEEQLTPKLRVRCPILRVCVENMDTLRITKRAIQHMITDLHLLQTQEIVNDLTAMLKEGLASLSLPKTSEKCAADCICRLTRNRVTPNSSSPEVLEVMQQVIDLFHTARHPHLHKEVREGTYTPARLDSRSPAPSDAFLDYPNRVVATPELRAGLDLLPQLLDTSAPMILYCKPGQGLSTFLDMFEKNQAPATSVIRFKCTPLSTAEDLFSYMADALLPAPLQDTSSTPLLENTESETAEWVKGDRRVLPQDPLPVLAPGEGGFTVLVLEDVNLQQENNKASGTLWEVFRLIVECGEIVCPRTGTRYNLQRVVPMLALTCTTSPEAIVPQRILRHCIIMALPHNSSATCEHIIKVCLQDILSEMDDDRLIPDATRNATIALYEDLQGQTPSSLTPSTHRSLTTDAQEGDKPSLDKIQAEEKDIEEQDEGRSILENDIIVQEEGSAIISVKNNDDNHNVNTKDDDDVQLKKICADAKNENCDSVTPNLHHLLQMTEALRRNTQLLHMTVGQSGSFVFLEACRAYAGIFKQEDELRTRILKVIKRHFQEVDDQLAWWPGTTEEGKRMMIHSEDYNEFLKNVQASITCILYKSSQ
ncbi:hypothetical protein SK128_023316, partial [Halocaridina rubra]